MRDLCRMAGLIFELLFEFVAKAKLGDLLLIYCLR